MNKDILKNIDKAKTAMSSWPEWKKSYQLTKNTEGKQANRSASPQPISRTCKK